MKYNKYSFQKYVYPDRWISYWHQIDATLRLTPENVLVVGKGDGIVVDILKKYIPRVESLDTEEKLEPDIVASVENYNLLRKNKGDSGVEILELSEVLAIALGIKKKEPEVVEEEISGEQQIILNIEADERMKKELKEEKEEEVKDWEK